MEILLGAVSILAIWMILGSGVTVDTTGMDLEGALFGIIGLYAFNAFKVIAGLIEIVINIILLAVPHYYLHNAVRNFKD